MHVYDEGGQVKIKIAFAYRENNVSCRMVAVSCNAGRSDNDSVRRGHTVVTTDAPDYCRAGAVWYSRRPRARVWPGAGCWMHPGGLVRDSSLTFVAVW